MVQVLFQDPYLRGELDEARRFVRYTRSSEGFPAIEDLERSYGSLIRAAQRLPQASLSLLIDLRDAPARNDPAFEKVMGPIRVQMMKGYRRVALVVKSAVGKLQVGRHMRQDGIDSYITSDEQDAVRYLEA